MNPLALLAALSSATMLPSYSGDLYTKSPLPEGRRISNNRLKPPGNKPRTWKKKPRKMTIALGVICGGSSLPPDGSHPGIVLATDSQVGAEGGPKTLDAQKISIVEFADVQVLVAYAGVVNMAQAVIEKFRQRAASVKIETADTVTDTAVEAIGEIRDKLKKAYEGCGFTRGDWMECFSENGFSLILGYFHEGKPFLRTIDFESGIPVPTDGYFVTIGCGYYLAEYILREHQKVDPVFETGLLAAGYAVYKTSANVDACGGPTQLGIVYPVPEEILRMQNIIQENNRRHGRPDMRKYHKSRSHLINREFIDSLAVRLENDERSDLADRKVKLRATMDALNQQERARLKAEDEADVQAELAKQKSVFGT